MNHQRVVITDAIKKTMEFVFVSVSEDHYIGNYTPFIASIDPKQITSLIQEDRKHCEITMTDGRKYIVCGTYRTLMNRWAYALQKTNDYFEDPIIFPSRLIFHSPNELTTDNIYFDAYQIYQFFQSLRPEISDQHISAKEV